MRVYIAIIYNFSCINRNIFFNSCFFYAIYYALRGLLYFLYLTLGNTFRENNTKDTNQLLSIRFILNICTKYKHVKEMHNT